MALGRFDSPERLVDLINGGSGQRLKNHIRSRHVYASILDQTACWKAWVQQLAVKLKGIRFFTPTLYMYIYMFNFLNLAEPLTWEYAFF